MASPKAVLSPDDYRNYRNVRAVSRLFILLGGLFALGGVLLLVLEPPRGEQSPHPLAAIAMAVVGVCGVVGGFATLHGNRSRSGLIKVMACFYFFAFPIGTILTYVLLTGLPKYFDSVDQLEAAA